MLAVLDYMFHGSCRRVSKVLIIAPEFISKFTVHEPAKKVSSILTIATEPKYWKCTAIDETKLKVKQMLVYLWPAVDVGSEELLDLEDPYGRSCLNAFMLLKKVSEQA